MLWYIVELVIKILLVIIGMLLGVAFLTVVERKYLSSIQRRKGPNVIGYGGLLQAISDGVKLLLKESLLPTSANSGIFVMSPIITFTLALMSWAVIPFNEGVVLSDVNIGLLYLLGMSSLGVYGIILAGWSSNSKYALLGGLRSTGQMISYEVSIGFTLVTCLLCSGTMNLSEIVLSQSNGWYIIGLLPVFIIFVISILAETNRHPFDLPEAEAELVSGYNVEYSGVVFVLFFLGEYGNMILMSSLGVILFLGGWLCPLGLFNGAFIFSIKVFIMLCVFVWARAGYPRYRYDQLMDIGWKVLLPLSMGFVILVSSLII